MVIERDAPRSRSVTRKRPPLPGPGARRGAATVQAAPPTAPSEDTTPRDLNGLERRSSREGRAKLAQRSAEWLALNAVPRFRLEQSVGIFAILLCFIAFQTPFLGFVSGASDDETTGYGRILTGVRVGAILIAFAAISRVRGQSVNWLSYGPVLFGFSALCLLSTVWSVDAYGTFRQSTLMILVLAIGVFVGARAEFRSIWRPISRYYFVVLLASVVVALALKKIGVHSAEGHSSLSGNWKGVFVHKNVLGGFAALSMIVFLLRPNDFMRSRLGQALAIGIAALCLVKSHSLTAFASVIFAFAACLFLRSRTFSASVKVVSLLIGSSLFVALMGVYARGDLDKVFQLFGKDSSLTGRAFIWKRAWSEFLSSPLIAHGFSVSSNTLLKRELMEKVFKAAVDVHSGYLYLLTEAGLVGTALFACMVVGAFVCALRALRLYRNGGDQETIWASATIVFLGLLIAVSEIGPFVVSSSFGFVFFFQIGLLYGMGALAQRRGAAKPQPRLGRRKPAPIPDSDSDGAPASA